MKHTYIKLIIIILYIKILKNNMIVESSKNDKKKVVIIGEITDIQDLLKNSTNNYKYHNKHSKYIHYHPDFRNENPSIFLRRRSNLPAKNHFVPIAAYSITHNRPLKRKFYTSSNNYFQYPENDKYQAESSIPIRTTESAVYGFINEPDIKGYNKHYIRPNLFASRSSSSSSLANYDTFMTSEIPTSALTEKPKGLGIGDLLLATLPVVFAPILSYLFTSMIIPIIPPVKKRRKRDNAMKDWKRMNKTEDEYKSLIHNFNSHQHTNPNNYTNLRGNMQYKARLNTKGKKIKVAVDYFNKIQTNYIRNNREMVNYLKCNGLLSKKSHCLERLACEFSDPVNSRLSAMDRSLISILLRDILKNKYINVILKNNIKMAALYGFNNHGKCPKYECHRINDRFT